MPDPDGTIAVNQVWASKTPSGSEETHELPSGQVVVARKIAIQQLLEAGVLAEADALTSLIGSKHLSTQASDVVQIAMKDPRAFGALMMMVDRALPLIVVEPEVLLHFTTSDSGETAIIPFGEREEGVYTDQIDLADKMWLLNWAVGDLNKLARFRGESDSAVATVADVEGVPDAPKRTSRNKPKRRG